MSLYKLLIALAMLPAAAMAQNNHYTIKGKIGNYNAPAKVYLTTGSKIDSAVFNDGTFTFTGTVDEPVLAWLRLNITGKGGYEIGGRDLYVEPGTITLTAKDYRIAEDGLTIGGSRTNRDRELFDSLKLPVYGRFDYIRIREKDATAEEKASPAFHKHLHEVRVSSKKQFREVHQKFIAEHPDSYISLDALKNLMPENEYSVIKPLYDLLSPALKNTKDGKALGNKLIGMKRVALGETAPEFTEADSSGRIISLSSFRGKYVLVDFWASWCGPCRAENPRVLKAYNKFKGENFTVVGISLDKSGEDWTKAVLEDGMPWTELIDKKNKTGQLYAVMFIPQNFLIDPQGKIIAKNLMEGDLEDELEEIFKKI